MIMPLLFLLSPALSFFATVYSVGLFMTLTAEFSTTELWLIDHCKIFRGHYKKVFDFVVTSRACIC
jgi:hypothetical protein